MAWVESYKVNGTSFDNERFAITRVEQSNPGLKGGNLVPAMDHGSQWRKKRLSSRSEMWSIWICDNQPGDAASFPGLPPATENGRRAQFHANWDEVMTILHTTHAATSAENSGGDAYEAPLQVVRKMKQNTSSPTDTYRVNYGEMTQAPAVGDYQDFSWAQFDVRVGYLDPRWYECDSSGDKTVSTLTADGNPGGTAIMTRMTIALASATNPEITNNTTGSKLKYNGTGAVTFDTTNFTAVSGSTTVTGDVDRTGSTTTDWFELRPGVDNDFSSNTTFTITYTKAYI